MPLGRHLLTGRCRGERWFARFGGAESCGAFGFAESFVRDNFRSIDSLGPGDAARVRALISKDVRELVDGASRVAWLPVNADVELTEAIDQVVGRERMRRCMKDGLLSTIEGPLLSPLRRSVQAVFGITPIAYLRRAPVAFNAIYREAGRFEFRPEGERAATIAYVEIPPEIGRSEAYVARHGRRARSGAPARGPSARPSAGSRPARAKRASAAGDS